MKTIRKLPWWFLVWAWLVLSVHAEPEHPSLPRPILSAQQTPPTLLPPTVDEKMDPPGTKIESKDDAKVLDLHLTTETMAVDLATVLRLAGMDNPQILLARERVLEAVAQRQYAAAQLLPSLHLGTSYDDHNGNLQRSGSGSIGFERLCVLPAVQLDDQQTFEANEVEDVSLVGMLALEFAPFELPSSQPLPKKFLGVSWRIS